MAYLLTNNILTDRTSSDVTISTGGQQSLFPFTKSFDGNPSTGFKSSTSTQPVVIINFPSVQRINALGIYAPDSSFSVSMQTNDTSTTDASHANWTNMVFDKSGSNTGTLTTVSVANNTTSAAMGISNTTKTDTRAVKLTFTNLSSTDDVVNHIQIGEVREINITSPYNPNTFKNFELTQKRNNNGNPLISDRLPVATKVTLKTGLMTQSDMSQLVLNTYQGLQSGGFMVCTSYDLTVESNTAAYYCIVDKKLDQPKFIDSTNMTWTIKALGYS